LTVCVANDYEMMLSQRIAWSCCAPPRPGYSPAFQDRVSRLCLACVCSEQCGATAEVPVTDCSPRINRRQLSDRYCWATFFVMPLSSQSSKVGHGQSPLRTPASHHRCSGLGVHRRQQGRPSGRRPADMRRDRPVVTRDIQTRSGSGIASQGLIPARPV
jgi:hypothetical protein